MQTAFHRGLNGFKRKSVDHDLVDCIAIRRQFGLCQPSKLWAVRVVRTGFQLGISRSDFASRAHDASWKWQGNVLAGSDCCNRRFSRGQREKSICPTDDEVSACDPGHCSKVIFADEFTVHRRDSPIATVFEFLGALKAIAEVANGSADAYLLFLRAIAYTVVTGRRRTGENALADSTLQCLAQCVDTKAKYKHRNTRSTIRRFVGCNSTFYGGFHIARYDAGGVAAHDRCSRGCPAIAVGRDY